MTHWAKPGVKCVCVSDWGGRQKWCLPKRRAVYTVDWVEWDHQGGPMLVLEEITAPRTIFKFPVVCFRPLIERTQAQDIALFQRIAESASHNATEQERA